MGKETDNCPLPQPASVVDTTRRRIISWSGIRGKEAVWHAAHFLRSSLLTRRSYEDGNIHPTFLSWCLYLSCLCVHAYSTAASLAASMPEVPELADSSDPLAYLDVVSLTFGTGAVDFRAYLVYNVGNRSAHPCPMLSIYQDRLQRLRSVLQSRAS